jgi:hypothetical protein
MTKRTLGTLAASFIFGVAALFSGSDAHAANPSGTGNFRRAEVTKVAGANPSTAKVMGYSTSWGNSAKWVKGLPDRSRIMAVAHQGGKVDLVKAPVNKSLPVTRMSTSQANRWGIITQRQAAARAKDSGGPLANGQRISVKATGLSGNSYGFKQTKPSGFYQNGRYVYNINRTVTLNGGKGETASAKSVRVFR